MSQELKIPEDERGHDGLTGAERIERMTQPPASWPCANCAQLYEALKFARAWIGKEPHITERLDAAIRVYESRGTKGGQE